MNERMNLEWTNANDRRKLDNGDHKSERLRPPLRLPRLRLFNATAGWFNATAGSWPLIDLRVQRKSAAKLN